MSAKKVLLSAALLTGSKLRNHVKDGVRALARTDRGLIAQTVRPEVGDSLDLDTTTMDEHPQANRWDYLLSVPTIGQIVGLEPHSARDSEISVVIAKKRHTIEYLRDHLPPRHIVTKWYWVSHGSVSFSEMEPARRRLDQAGITFKGRMLKSFG